MTRIASLSGWAWINVAGLLLTAVGMLVQIGAGSTLYPSLSGPIVLAITAAAVAFGPLRWTRWLALGVPLVLGIGAAIAAAMTGTFIDQLTDTGNPAILVGSVMHVVGLAAAVGGGIGLVIAPREGAALER